MLPVNTVYMCTIIPTLNSIQSPCLHLAVIRVYHTEFLRLRQFKEKYIYTLSNSQFFFPSKILVHAPAFKNLHAVQDTRSIHILVLKLNLFQSPPLHPHTQLNPESLN